MQLSKLEARAYETLRKNNLVIFKTKDLMLLLSIDKVKAYNLIKALKRKNAIIPLKNGTYMLYGVNELAAGTYLNWPSYLSFWSALSYYGFSDQVPKTIFYATTRYKKKTGNYKYVSLSRKKFFGYLRIGEITIADKEKALIDSLLFPKYSGGIKEIEASIKKALPEVDTKKLIGYAVKTGSKAALRRLGYILESLGYKQTGSMRKNIGKGYELLDPSLEKKNNLNKKWLLDINDDIPR